MKPKLRRKLSDRAHVKEFHHVYGAPNSPHVKWVHVTLQIVVADQTEAAEVGRRRERWIACSDRMPDTAEAVMVVNNGVREMAWHSAMGWYGYRDALLVGVTHWTPLPAPPEANRG